MVHIIKSLIVITIILIDVINGQFDPTWCPNGPTPPDPEPRWHPVPSRFEILTELVGYNDEVMDVFQAFSTNRDTVFTYANNNPTGYYWNYPTDEHLEVTMSLDDQEKEPKCDRKILTNETVTSLIDDKYYLKPSVILGYDSRNHQNLAWGIRYEMDGSLRDIPTNIFKSCFYVNDIHGTVQVTYHIADTVNYQTYALHNETILLQLDVNMTSIFGAYAYTYNVFRYIPNPRPGQERQLLETPSGVYCLNRTSEREVPSNIPDRVSSNSEAVLPTFNNTLVSAHSLYDTEYLFSRFEIWAPNFFGRSDWLHFTEMHDFGTGLSYRYNHNNRQCTVHDIFLNSTDATPVDGSPNLLQMGDPQHLFLMDDITYQYVGEKRCRDRVWCHVWIGENHYPNNTVEHREWYWATRVNGIALSQWIPMKFIGKRYVEGNLNFTYETTVFNYRTNPMTIFEIDYTLAECYRALGPINNFNLGVLSFRIANDRAYPVFQNLNYLRLHIWETLVFTLFIRPIRISNIVVDKDDKDILVTFTLLDGPPRTGPVEFPLTEPSLDTLIDRLKSIIDSNGLAFRARYGSKHVILRTRINSLNIAHLSSDKKARTSGPLITALWIVCGVAGVVIGAVGGFLLLKKFMQ